VNLITHLHLVPRSSIHGAVVQLSHTSSWRGACLSARTTLSLHYVGGSSLSLFHKYYDLNNLKLLEAFYVLRSAMFKSRGKYITIFTN